MYRVNSNEEAIVVKSEGRLGLDDRKAITEALATMLRDNSGRKLLIDHTDSVITHGVVEAVEFAMHLLSLDLWRYSDEIYVMVEDGTRTRQLVDVTAMASMDQGKSIKVCLDRLEVALRSGFTDWPFVSDD